jgi:hypothetical protein
VLGSFSDIRQKRKGWPIVKAIRSIGGASQEANFAFEALVNAAFIEKRCFLLVRPAVHVAEIRCEFQKCGAKTSMTLLVGWASEASRAGIGTGQNVGMLQIGGVLAHNNRRSNAFKYPLFHDSGDPHGSTRHSLYRSVG